jgi:hypothetical protein
MIFNYFKKDRHKSISKELDKMLPSLPLATTIHKTRIRTASSKKPYKYLTEGTIQGRKLILSVQTVSPLAPNNQYLLELILHCENPSWIHVKMGKSIELLKLEKSLDLQKIHLHGLQSSGLTVACNQTDFVQQDFDTPLLQSMQSINWDQISLAQLSRKRLYIKLKAIEIKDLKAALLQNILQFSIQLLHKTDQFSN